MKKGGSSEPPFSIRSADQWFGGAGLVAAGGAAGVSCVVAGASMAGVSPVASVAAAPSAAGASSPSAGAAAPG
jgi:hypothetical protein